MKYVLVLLFILLTTNSARSQTLPTFPSITTVEIINNTLACIDCMEWEPVGICFFLKCSLFHCEINESLKVSHYTPDLVIATYTSQSVWEETREMNDVPAGAMAEVSGSFNNTPVDFKHVDIYSHPVLPVWSEIMGSYEFFCQSQLPPIPMPLYLSGLDPFWKDPTIERLFPQSWLGMPKINTGQGDNLISGFFGGYWAPEYPRCGWGAHPYDAINAAVAAHRATHIITRKVQPHLYNYIAAGGNCGSGEKCWPPKPVKANDKINNRFQMLYPMQQTSAKAFGGSAKWANGKSNGYQTYLWTGWRKYKCCDKKGVFIGSVDWN